jgi:intracellular sulfur oxidation DsrE/DsrF family protein
MKSRREIVSALTASGAVLAAASGARANPVVLDPAGIKKETDFACVYHCDFGDPAYEFDPFKLKIVVVAHSAGIKFFLDDLSGTPWAKETIDPEIYKRFVGLSKYGVEAYLCQIAFKRQNVDPAKTRRDAFLKFVPSGVATVAELQTKGFAYIKVG